MEDIAKLSDTQSESGIIGTLIYHPEFIFHSDYLLPSYFFNTDNGCIYWAIQELSKEGITNIDAFNLSSKLQSNKAVKNTIERYNLPAVQEWFGMYKVVARHTLEEYRMLADNVMELAFKRDLVKTLDGLESKVFQVGSTLNQLSNDMYGEFDRLTEKYVVGDEIATLGEEIDDIWEEIENDRTADGTYGIRSKFPSFEPYFTYVPGELTLIQAKMKNGKSAMLMNEAVHKLQNGVAVLVVDTEMNKKMYVARLLGHISGVNYKKILAGNFSTDEENRVAEAKAWIKTVPFVYRYEPDITMEKLYSMCKALKRKIGLGFVVFDYIKCNERESDNVYNLLGAKCDYLKNRIAGELELAVLSAAQLNRQNEIADSYKINWYLSVGIKWGYKTQEQQMRDGIECGNMYAKIYVNRLGEQMAEDDEDDYIDFIFDGNTMTIQEAEQHKRTDEF